MTQITLRLLCVTLTFVIVARSAEAQDYGPPQLNFGCEGCNSPHSIETRASLLLLRPGGGNLDYGLMASPLPLPTPNWEYLSVSPDFTPAFNIGLGYVLSNYGNDIQLSWTHLNTRDSASAVADPTDQFVGPPYEIGPDAGLFRFANATTKFEFDSVNLDVGQFVDTGGPFMLRVFGGLQFARIGSNLSARFESEDGFLSNAYVNDSLFTGLGPRFGMRAQSTRGNLDLVGEFAGSVLVGKSESRLDFAATSPELEILEIPSPNRQALTSRDATRVIPSIESKLGTGYTLPGKHYGLIRFETGYQVAVYVNAINQYSISEVVTPPVDQSVGIYLRTASPTKSDFTAHGPYFTASWVF